MLSTKLFIAFLQNVDNILARKRARVDAEQAAHRVDGVVRNFAEVFRLHAITRQAQFADIAALLQVGKRCDKVFRFLRIRLTKCTGDGNQLITRGLKKAAPVRRGNHD